MTLLFGWIAAGISSVFRLPQLVQILQTRRVQDLSFVSLLCQFIVCPLYVAHGAEIGDRPTVTMGLLSGIQATVILWLYLRFVPVTPEGEGEEAPPD